MPAGDERAQSVCADARLPARRAPAGAVGGAASSAICARLGRGPGASRSPASPTSRRRTQAHGGAPAAASGTRAGTMVADARRRATPGSSAPSSGRARAGRPGGRARSSRTSRIARSSPVGGACAANARDDAGPRLPAERNAHAHARLDAIAAARSGTRYVKQVVPRHGRERRDLDEPVHPCASQLEAVARGCQFPAASSIRRADGDNCDASRCDDAVEISDSIRRAPVAPRLQPPDSAPPFCTRGDPVVETRPGLLVSGVRVGARGSERHPSTGTPVAGMRRDEECGDARCFDNRALRGAYCMRRVDSSTCGDS